MLMIIIGMTGPIGHGKSTFAKAIGSINNSTIRFESSLIISEVANALHQATGKLPDRYSVDSINDWLKPLPRIIEEIARQQCSLEQIIIEQSDAERHPIEYDKLMLHLESLQRNPEMLHQQITVENKEAYRPVLQWLGGYLVKNVSADIWYNEILRRVKVAENEGYEICIIGGLRFPRDANNVRKSGGVIIKVYRPDHLQYDMLDPTERERDNIPTDSTIVSNGTVEDMLNCAKQVIKDIQENNLQKLYQTKRFN